MNKTKIIASIGPESYRSGILEEMVISGADVIRLNMCYSDHKFCEKVIKELTALNIKLNSSIAIMIDLEGPSIRTLKFKGDKALFKTGDKIRMYMKPVVGNDTQFSVDYPELINELKAHSVIKLSNGNVILEVLEIGLDYVVCEVICGGEVESLSKIDLPEIRVNRKFLSEQDKEDILFASEMGADFLAISNVTSAEDVLEVNDLLIELNNNHISVLTKIQNNLAAKDIDKIIDVSEGIIIARNDLVTTIPIENVPIIKNTAIKKCLNNGKISIVSADLESFLNNKAIPSRSEVSDLVNTVSLGVDSIMLSSETTIGRYPTEAIKQVERIVRVAEKNIDYEYFYESALKTEIKNIAGTIAAGVMLGTLNLDAKAIIVATDNGFSAKQISRFRPPCIIIAIVPDEKTAKSLNLHFGIIAVVISDYDFDTLSTKSTLIAEKMLELEKKDKIIIVGGHPFNNKKHNNFIKIEEI